MPTTPSPRLPSRPRAEPGTLRASWQSWWSFSLASPGPAWLQYFWTLLFNTGVALVLTMITWGFSSRGDLVALLKWNWVVSQAIGYSIHILFEIGGRLVGRARIERFTTPQRVAFFAGLPIVGCLIGYWIGLTLLGVDVGRLAQGTPRVVVGVLLVSIVISTLWYRYALNRTRLAQAEADRERERTRVAELERLALAAQLRSLQAQMEPHFLFNTLANVVSLIDAAPDKARRMLERLIELLRASLAASRSERTTLGQECALLEAYLDILAIRMGGRLRYGIDVPEALSSVSLPPLSLQPLVENAVKHGLEPKIGGGTVFVRARDDRGRLVIEVEDDGLGFGAAGEAGVGLANLRERLAAAYGDRARLAVESRDPGTRVRLMLPIDAP